MRLSSLLTLTVMFSACTMPGERAGSHSCPPGETCSLETPHGLRFAGYSLDGTIHPTAVAGTQTITIYGNGGDPTPSDFDAASSGPAFTIGGVAPPSVEIHGVSAGTAYLRILEPGTNLLYDRVVVGAKDLAAVELEPGCCFKRTHGNFVLLAGKQVRIGANLYSSDDDWLVDTSTRLTLVATPLANAHDAQWNGLTLSMGVSTGVLQVSVR